MVNCIQAATGRTQDALKLLQDVHKMLGPIQTESSGVRAIQSLSDMQAHLGKEARGRVRGDMMIA
jgi:hypothetical protein